MTTDDHDNGGPLAIWRCTVCGDTYPALEATAPCPSCGAAAGEIAHEPLL